MVEPAKKSDLGTRVLSAVVMVAVAGVALWLGSWVFTAFVVAVGLGVIWEWWGLASKIAKTPFSAGLWLAAGLGYVGAAMAMLLELRNSDVQAALAAIMLVIAIDVGAYFAGRAIGGPKIAPSISPSKTWAGLLGGVMGAWLWLLLFNMFQTLRPPHPETNVTINLLLVAIVAAVVAQAGDFFESWMKRRAGVKDSGTLIPGHGGLFDRVDGLLAVLFVPSVISWVT